MPASEGEAGGLRVELFGLRLARCGAADHPPEAPARHFAADLVAAAEAGDAIPVVRRGGWLGRGRATCFRCGQDLGAVAPASAEVRARLRVKGGAPLTVTVVGPARACGECRLVQLEDTVSLGEALLGALGAAGLGLP